MGSPRGEGDAPDSWGLIDWVSDQNADGVCDLVMLHVESGTLAVYDANEKKIIWKQSLAAQARENAGRSLELVPLGTIANGS